MFDRSLPSFPVTRFVPIDPWPPLAAERFDFDRVPLNMVDLPQESPAKDFPVANEARAAS